MMTHLLETLYRLWNARVNGGILQFQRKAEMVDWSALRDEAKKYEAVALAAQALLDPEGTLAAAGVNPGPERTELERALADLALPSKV